MRNEAGQIIKWFGTCTDIEDQKRSESVMKQAIQELRQSNDDLDSFVYTASHDLKLPLLNMGALFTELLEMADFTDPEAPNLIRLFERSFQQLNQTLADLAEIVKVQKNINSQADEFEISQLLDEVKLSLSDMIENSGARIMASLKIRPIYFSKVNFRSILYNLLSNAIKYARPGEAPQVQITASATESELYLTVADKGIGIDLHRNREKLFQMFRRFHNHVEGTGLGLYIVNRIVENNKGRIEVNSQVGEGTTFTIYLPHTASPTQTHDTD